MRFSLRSAVALLMVVSLTSAAAFAQDAAGGGGGGETQEGVITGTMSIDFQTRTNLDTSGDLQPNSAAVGVQDKYSLNLNVNKLNEFAGDITRHPNLYTKTLRKQKQGAQLGYYLNISVLNPKDLKQKRKIGSWVGVVPIDTKTGAFDLAGGKAQERPLRIAVDTVGRVKGFTDNFAGRLVGRAEQKDNLAGYTYKRLRGKKTVEFKVAKVDPMKFEGVELAKGPTPGEYPRAVVNGRLDFDYDTGNWITDGIRFKYTHNGTEIEDVVTGTIKWVEADDRQTSGKGQYEFNLRFNEEQNAGPDQGAEGDAFAEGEGEEAFFAVDTSIPTLTGTIEYVDTFIPGGTTPSASKVTYNLHANKLTKQQVMNFFKLWVLCIGPANDE